MTPLERTTLAFAFVSDLSLRQMKQILDARGLGAWVFGDSEWYGDYLGGSIAPRAVARIYALKYDRRFHLSLRLVTESDDARAKARLEEANQTVLEQVLPAIQGKDLRAVEPLG